VQVQTALADTPGNKLSSKAQAILQANDFAGVVRLLLPHLDLMLQAADDHSMDACLILLIQMVVRTVTENEDGAADATATSLADEFMSALINSSVQKPVARMAAMLELFNSWPRPGYQHSLLVRILTFASKEKVSQLAVPLYGRADLWDRAWQLEQKQAMEMFEGIAKVLDMHPSPLLKKEAFALQTRVLLACPADDKARVQSLKPTARAAALAFIGNAAQFSCDIYSTAPVQALKDDPKDKAIFELLDLVLHGKLAEFDSSKFASVMEEAQTSESELLNKVSLPPTLNVLLFQRILQTTPSRSTSMPQRHRVPCLHPLQAAGASCTQMAARHFQWLSVTLQVALSCVQMRLMALLSVCSSKEGQDVSFIEIEKALALESGQAEGWLVQAFGKQLLDGRINQV
jgi:hypothetical protein